MNLVRKKTAAYEFVPKATGRTTATSANEKQYLKYWDRTTGMQNYFYAYAPYKLGVSFDPATRKMTFPIISSVEDNGASAMYASVKKASPAMSGSNSFVDLEFKRLLAQIRLAFYEVVPGYSVELVDYSSNVSIPDDDKWKSFGHKAMYAVPSKFVDPGYSSAEYVTAARPVVTFADDMKGTVTYTTDVTKTDKNINIPLWFYSGSTQTNVLGVSHETAIMNDVKEVLPQPGDHGFTLNLSLKFTALDTGEVIYVKGVRVYIPKSACEWKANYIYTYYFKVTQSVPGTSVEPTGTDVTPGNDKYLMPIVFDDVTIQEVQTGEFEYNIN